MVDDILNKQLRFKYIKQLISFKLCFLFKNAECSSIGRDAGMRIQP